jgi:hypothetical protein
MTTEALPERGARATLTRLSDTLLLGAAVTVTSLGVVTVGPALLAAARVVRGWEAGDQPSIVSTFVATVRADTVRLLLPQLALVGVLAFVWVDLVVAGAGIPGATLVRAVAAALAAVAVATWLVAVVKLARSCASDPGKAMANAQDPFAAWRAAARLCGRQVWLPVALVAVVAVVGLMVAVAPATVVVAAGPLMLAVGVLVSRAERRQA